MSLTFLKPTKELTPRQKQVLKGFSIRKPRKFKDENGYQQKRINYWCPVENDNYQATDRHQHCKLCYVKKYGDLHPIIKNLYLPKNMNTEYQEQCCLVEYLEILKAQGKVVLFTALPNNVWTRSWSQKVKQKKEGLRKGFPDLCIILKNRFDDNKLIFIEMKREKGGTVSTEQKEWNEVLNTIVDCKAYICKGFDQAKKVIDEYL